MGSLPQQGMNLSSHALDYDFPGKTPDLHAVQLAGEAGKSVGSAGSGTPAAGLAQIVTGQ